MLYIPKIGGLLKILNDGEVKDFVIMNSGEYFKYTREKLYSNLSEEKNLRKVVGSFFVFPATPDEIEKYFEMMQSSSSDN